MRRIPALLALTLTALCASTLFAVAKVDWPLAKVYASSRIVIGAVEARSDDNHVLTVKITALPKETPDFAVGDTIKVQIAQPESLYPKTYLHQPLVLFIGAKDIIAHLANEWCLAQAGNSPKTYRIAALHDKFRGTFPGRTTDLFKALDELKAGKSTLLDAAPPKLLSAQEKVEAVADVAAALKSIEDAKGNLPELKDALSITGGKFGTTGDLSFLALTKSGLLRLPLGFGGPTTMPAGPVDDDIRLLGSSLRDHITEWKDAIPEGRIFTADVNADGRDDAVIVSPQGTLLLLNRGFGAFLVVKLDGDAFKNALAVKADPKSGGLLVLRKTDTGAEFWRASTPQ